MRYFWTPLVLLFIAHSACAQNRTGVGVTPDEAKEGYVSLFDGKTLLAWFGDIRHYAVENGLMVCHGGDVYVHKPYANFILRFDFRLPPGGNNGVAIRAPGKGDAAYVGMEIQILDDGHEMYQKMKPPLQPYQYHGSIYGVVAAKHGFLKPTGQWNSEEIMADGSHIKVTLNGTVITDADISQISETPDGKPHPGLHNAKGYIGWLGHGRDPVAFRNVRIKELP
jgi:hypothetical protein